MKYRCLVMDHDDTVVRSAETVNYPALLLKLAQTHPERTISFEDFTRECFQYGFTGMCAHALHLTPEEILDQFDAWKIYVRTHIPPVYDGVGRIFQRFRENGGIVCVSSHSGVENITRDYQQNFGFTPDAIYAYELGVELRKPNPYTLREIMRRFDLQPSELLMVDDMKSGYDMAQQCAVPFACAGWSHFDEEIIAFMRQNSDIYFETPVQMEAHLFDE